MKIDRILSSEEARVLELCGKSEVDFETETLDYIDHRLSQYTDVAKRKLARNKTIAELESND